MQEQRYAYFGGILPVVVNVGPGQNFAQAASATGKLGTFPILDMVDTNIPAV